ncbi:pirin family protein [Aquabacterium sp. A7-Y]|uniref:pirin family protein n=1 Tax=Aquabacterium sp. A7-Y TaxID=1349605 RepID=UPI00223D018F|nr:pirin family protein [Aquabacterium sp. A7-Y]MCW7539608.1 pirin family protein [Aquabacterium sp. A7-Y]
MEPVRLHSQTQELGTGLQVRRLLPARDVRAVGPFVFFDHIGPADFQPGLGMDVGAHPHIGLATVTYLFDGAILHRDSLGSVREIRPGEVNWMSAGRGIAHSERTPPAQRAAGHRLHGIQTWMALPLSAEESAPQFVHVGAEALPCLEMHGVQLRVVVGDAFGLQSPVPVHSRTLYIAAEMPFGSSIELPLDHVERAVYVASGSLSVDGDPLDTGEMLVLANKPVRLRALEKTQTILFGGDPLDLGAENTPQQPRHMRWNFVSSQQARIDAAVAAWQRQDRQAFGAVPDETEYLRYP